MALFGDARDRRMRLDYLFNSLRRLLPLTVKARLILLVVTGEVLLALLTINLLQQSRLQAEQHARTSSEYMARLLAADLGGSFDQINLMLLTIKDAVERQPGHDIRSPPRTWRTLKAARGAQCAFEHYLNYRRNRSGCAKLRTPRRAHDQSGKPRLL